jgi:four helix bundle protein
MGRSSGLRALEAAQLLASEILSAVELFPSPDPAGLRRQLSEAANSVAANIAEEMGRGTRGEKLHFLRMARGSLEETQSHLKVCRSAEYIDTKRFLRLWNLSVVLGRMLSALIAKIEREQPSPRRKKARRR